jgi:hypothetical protein
MSIGACHKQTRMFQVRPCVAGNSGFHGDEYWIPTKRLSDQPLTQEAILFALQGLIDVASIHPRWFFCIKHPQLLSLLGKVPPNVLLTGVKACGTV